MTSDNAHPTSDRTPSRRDFLKTSSAVAVATGLGITRSAHAAGSDSIRIALVGCGGRGTGAAVNALTVDPHLKLVAMGDAFADRLDSSLQSLLDSDVAEQVDVGVDSEPVGSLSG